MCVKCDGKGYIDSCYKFIEKYKKETIEDYKWREEACICDLGKSWLEHQINIGYNMACRMDKFISDNLGKRKVRGRCEGKSNNRLANSQDLIDMYLSGKRSFQDNPTEIDWTRV